MIGSLAGRPWERWDKVSKGAAGEIRAARKECTFTAKQNDHRRGRFPALAVGISYGGGQKVSYPLPAAFQELTKVVQ